MTDKPLTAEDFDCSAGWIKDSVKAAKRLLKSIGWNTTDGSYICKLCQRHTTIKSARNGYCIWCEIDACFQIDDSEEAKE